MSEPKSRKRRVPVGYLGIESLCERLNISRRYYQTLRGARELNLTEYSLGKSVMYNEREVETKIQENTVLLAKKRRNGWNRN